MTDAPREPLAGVEPTASPSLGWIPLDRAPTWLAFNPVTGRNQIPLELSGDLIDAGATAEVDWPEGNLNLFLPSEAAREPFAKPIGVAAFSNGDGILWLWGSPLNFLRIDLPDLAALTAPAIAQAVVEDVAKWWGQLTRLASGSFRFADGWSRVAGVVARAGSPIAPKFTLIPGDAFEVVTVTDWRKGTAESPCGCRLYAMHLVPNFEIENGNTSEADMPERETAPADRSMARRGLRLLEAVRRPIDPSNPRWNERAREVGGIAREKGFPPLHVTGEALRKEYERSHRRTNRTR